MPTVVLKVSAESESLKRFIAGLRGAAATMDEPLVRAAENITREAWARARGLIPSDRGVTAETVGWHVDRRLGGATGYVGTSDEVAEGLEFGTEPHEIRVRPERVAEYEARLAAWQPGSGPRPRPPSLRFEGSEGPVFVTHPNAVHHPGTPEYAWLLRAAEGVELDAGRYLQEEVEEHVSQWLSRST